MDIKMRESNWSTYEQEVFDCFRTYFPKADIRKNVRIKGRYSKRLRQIDILITEKTPAGPSRIVVDAKLHNRKLNVKAVEEFEGFVNDIGADKGLLISNKGYTRSALRRAYYCPRDLELDILDFSELKRWQAFGAIPYVRDKAFLVPAPFGWVVDITASNNCLCTMFQRGLDIETAKKNKEFLYINFVEKKKKTFSMVELDKLQVARLKALGYSINVSHRATVKRKDAKTRLRYMTVKQYKCLEVTGFLEFKDTIVYAVLLTSIEKQKQNVRRLQHILQSAVPFILKADNTALIATLKDKLRSAKSNEEQAKLLHDIGHWYGNMMQFAEAQQHLEESVSLSPNYYNIKELIYVLLELGDCIRIKELLNNLLLLDLTNPTVFNDALTFAHIGHLEEELIFLLQSLAADQATESLAKANCLYYSAQLLLQKDAKSTKKSLNAAREIFRKLLPPEHQVFKALRFSLKQCELALKDQ
jgi:tetratricopeptide (TPR) repeat protein